MKSIYLLTIALAAVACTTSKPEIPTTYISGKYIDQEEVQSIYVRDYSNELGYLHPIHLDTIETNEDGSFSWSFKLTGPKEIALHGDSEFRVIYLEPGDSIYYESDADYYSPATNLSGKGSDKIAVLEELKTLLQLRPIAGKDSAEIMPEYDRQVARYEQIIDSSKTVLSADFHQYLQSTLLQNKRYILSIIPWYVEGSKKIKLEIDSTVLAKTKSDLFDFAHNEPSNFRFTEDLFYGLSTSSRIDSLTPEENLARYEEKVFSMNFSPVYTQQLLGMKYLAQMEDGKAEIITSKLEKLAQNYPGNAYQKTLEKQNNEWLAISAGAMAPNFTANYVDSTQFEFAELVGKVVYIDIWATWCGPCIREIPDSKEIKDQFADNEDIVFLNVSIDSQIDRWKSFLEEHPEMTGINVNDPRDTEAEVCEDYKVNGIPRYVLIGRDGKIIDTDAYRPSQKDELINQLNEALGISIAKM